MGDEHELHDRLKVECDYQIDATKRTIYDPMSELYLDSIEAYNLITQQWELINFEQVMGVTKYQADQVVDNEREFTEIQNKKTLQGYESFIPEENQEFIKQEMMKCCYYEGVQPDDIILMLSYKMSIPIDCYLNFDRPHLLGDKTPLEYIIPPHMELIKSRISDVKQELDDLIQQTKLDNGTQDDIDDIESIKSMFDDIPSELNLNRYTDWISLVQNWPAMLQPTPFLGGNMSTIKRKSRAMSNENNILEFTKMLHAISDYDQIIKLHDQWMVDDKVPSMAKELLLKRVVELKCEQYL